MKNLFILMLGVFMNANLITVNAQQKDLYMARNFPASTISAVEASTSGGSITVSGDAGSQAIVEVFASRDRWSAEQIKQAVEENYTIDIKVVSGKLTAEVKQKNKISNWNQQGVSISLKISVPRQVDSNLQTSGGSIHISNLTGSQDFRTSGGSLTVENVSGNIVGRTSGGSITVSNSSDNIDLTTSGGSITAKDCNGKINLKTSGGSIKMTNLDGDIQANTSGGSITADAVRGSLNAKTSGGSVNLKETSGNVEAKTSGGSMTVEMLAVNEFVKLSSTGSINLTMPANKGYNLKVKANKIETSGMKDFRGNIESRNMDGTIGNGGTQVDLNTSGRVNLTFK